MDGFLMRSALPDKVTSREVIYLGIKLFTLRYCKMLSPLFWMDPFVFLIFSWHYTLEVNGLEQNALVVSFPYHICFTPPPPVKSVKQQSSFCTCYFANFPRKWPGESGRAMYVHLSTPHVPEVVFANLIISFNKSGIGWNTIRPCHRRYWFHIQKCFTIEISQYIWFRS